MQRLFSNARATLAAFAAIALAGSASVASAQASCPEDVSVHTPSGSSDAVDATGSHAYLGGSGMGLTIVDVGNPDSPFEAGTYPLAVTESEVVGGLAFIASNNAADPGFFIIDVADPAAASYVSNIATGLPLPYNVAVDAPYAYVGHWFNGLVVIDFSDIFNPVVVATHPHGYDVKVDGSYLYATERGTDPGDGLRIIDISNPLLPSHVGNYDLPHSETLDIDYPHAYVTVTGYSVGGLHVIDVSSPAAPTEVGYNPDPFEATRVVVEGGYAYVTANAAGALNDSVYMIDVSNPASPTTVGVYELPTPSHSSNDLKVLPPHVYLAAGTDFRILTTLCGALFYDGFETADTIRWSLAVGLCPPCTAAIGCRLVGGKAMFVVPMSGGLNGTAVCAAHGYQCIDAPVLTPPEAACLEFHPGATVSFGGNGWKQAVWCDQNQGAACTGRTGCHHCPPCVDWGLDCSTAGSVQLSELFVECICN